MDQSLLRVVLPRDIHRVTELLKILDQGESEAIVLAAEVGADLILIDEATGREMWQNSLVCAEQDFSVCSLKPSPADCSLRFQKPLTV